MDIAVQKQLSRVYGVVVLKTTDVLLFYVLYILHASNSLAFKFLLFSIFHLRGSSFVFQNPCMAVG